jgi:hypothetical protein
MFRELGGMDVLVMIYARSIVYGSVFVIGNGRRWCDVMK